jgi:partner of Y14 and mago protein
MKSVGIPGMPPGAGAATAAQKPAAKPRRRKKSSATEASGIDDNDEATEEAEKAVDSAVKEQEDPQVAAAKKLKNLRKKLREINELAEKFSNASISPSAEQQQKLNRKAEVENEIAELEAKVPAAT